MKGDKLLEAVNVHRSVLQAEVETVDDAITVSSFLLWTFICDLSTQIPETTPEALLAKLVEQLPTLARETGFQVQHIIVPDQSIVVPTH